MKKFRKPDGRPGGGGRDGRPNRGGGQLSRGGSPSRGGGHPSRGGGHARGPRPSEAAIPQGRCVVGIHANKELLKVRAKAVDQMWFRENHQDHPDLKALYDDAKVRGVKIQTYSAAHLDKVVTAHQGVLGFTQEQPELDWDQLKTAETACLLALDEVEDPHNLGAILRTAWLFGALGVLTPEHRSAYLSPAVSKVAQGAVEHVPVVRDSSLPTQLEQLKELGFWVLGLSHKARQDIFSFEIPKKVIWVLGSESSGLRKSVEGACDDLITIPQSAPNASYNVSVAGAIAMAETFRQHQSP